MKLKTVIFDMDGTLLDTERLVMECWMEVVRIHKLKDITELYLNCIGTNEQATEAMFQEYYGSGTVNYQAFCKEAAALYYKKIEKSGIPLKKGAYELLKYLKEEGFHIGLATSTRREAAFSHLAQTELLEFFDQIITGDMVKRSKPYPDIFRKACEEMGAEPEYTYAIEDSFNGVRAADAAGMRVLMVPDIVPADDEIRSRCRKVFSSLNEVSSYLQCRA